MLLPNNLNSKLFVFCTEAANMTDERFFQKDFKSMSALGRNFKVGDLYNQGRADPNGTCTKLDKSDNEKRGSLIETKKIVVDAEYLPSLEDEILSKNL